MEIKTIGYGAFYSQNEGEMIATLKLHLGDFILLDVRAKPYGALNYNSLKENIPKYHLVKEFGNDFKLKNDMFNISDERFLKGIERVKELIQRHGTNKIMLMCSEKDVTICHRLIISKKIQSYFKDKGEITLKHIYNEDFYDVKLETQRRL